MKILFVNPNSTDSMTQKVADTAATVIPSDVTVEAISNLDGPPSIQGPEDGELAAPGMLAAIDKGIRQGADGVVIACFDDTALAQARALSNVPVIGIGQAAYHMSMLNGYTFSVVTTLSVSVPILEKNIQEYGLSSHCRNVRASDVPVLELEIPGSSAEQRVSDEIALALKEDQCEAVVLGCAGMTDLASRLESHHKVPVFDGVAAASALMHGMLVSRGLARPNR